MTNMILNPQGIRDEAMFRICVKLHDTVMEIRDQKCKIALNNDPENSRTLARLTQLETRLTITYHEMNPNNK